MKTPDIISGNNITEEKPELDKDTGLPITDGNEKIRKDAAIFLGLNEDALWAEIIKSNPEKAHQAISSLPDLNIQKGAIDGLLNGVLNRDEK